MKIVSLFERGETDGYQDWWDGVYYFSKSAAESGKSGYTRTREVKAILLDNGQEAYILAQPNTVVIEGTEAAKEARKRQALSKLTKEEQKLLGLA